MTTALLLAILLLPTRVAAQQGGFPPEVSRSFDQLSRAETMQDGDRVWVYWELARIRQVGTLAGTFAGLTGADISIVVDEAPPVTTGLAVEPTGGGYRVLLPEELVWRVDAEFADSLTNGIVVGALVGFSVVAVPTAIWMATCEGFCFGPGARGLVLAVGSAGAGALIGASLDASVKTRATVFATADVFDTRVSVSFVPLITRRDKGLLFTLNW